MNGEAQMILKVATIVYVGLGVIFVITTPSLVSLMALVGAVIAALRVWVSTAT